ncbi:MAG: hypothetical protein BGO69_10310 [Bacteroidetes bacterium 46-16]|mgnify:CR=1 FL=1|nr:MAG: hypothetical protein BGO69_10310 [Bacteroidetes bacterium 46-16]
MKNVLQIRKLIIVALLLITVGKKVEAQPWPTLVLEDFGPAWITNTMPEGWIDSNLSRSHYPVLNTYNFRTPGHQVGGWALGPDSPATGELHGYANIAPFDATDGFLYSRADSAMGPGLNFLYQYDSFTVIDNWVFLPVDSISDNTHMSFYTSTDPGLIANNYLDSLQVYYNITDTSTDTSKFVRWTGFHQAPQYPQSWTYKYDSLNLLVPANTHTIGRVAFRHHVVGDQQGAVSWFVAIDDINLNTYPLPMSLVSLYCTPDKDNNVNVYWETASENNNAYFIVERTVDGKNFKQLGKVKAAGNSTVKQNYSFQDVTAASAGYNKVMYRLKQVDANGKYGYSQVVTATLTSTGVSNMLNPYLSGNTLHINFMTADAGMVGIQVLNSNGQKVAEMKKETAEGLNIATMDFSSMPSGIYIVRVSGKTETLINRFVK